MVTFAGIGSDLQEKQIGADELLVDLVEGWRYLLPRDPKVVRWTVEHQAASSEWAPYRVGGSPISPS
ncbi:hypothetical protein [Belnapia sp. F-4-1]|uniref:hypothetical protein n=1 Tax=Belnapia sp. F-4-1 TaxID=1545443 RepID=UPI0011872E7C|nr:hypothetical protein [Belnapia sp. F-4-1]